MKRKSQLNGGRGGGGEEWHMARDVIEGVACGEGGDGRSGMWGGM